MARPKKNNAEYFPHDANERNNPPVMALRRKFPHTGYAAWNYLRETLTGNAQFRIEWNEVAAEILAADYMMDAAELIGIVEYAIKVGLLAKEDDTIFAPEHRASLQPLLLRRERDRQKIDNQGNEVIDNDNHTITHGNTPVMNGNDAETDDNGAYCVDNTTAVELSRVSLSKSKSIELENIVRERDITHTVSFKRKGGMGGEQNAPHLLVWLNTNYPEFAAMAEPLIADQAAAILDKYTDEDINRIVEAIDNKGATKNKSAYATFNSFVAHDRILKERNNVKPYAWGDVCDMVCNGTARQEDFEARVKDGVRYWVRKIDLIRV